MPSLGQDEKEGLNWRSVELWKDVMVALLASEKLKVC
jgi:hypothetical protein